MSSAEFHILVVDDARDIREPLGLYLRKNGYRASLAADATGAREAIELGSIDLVVLDIMMPGEDGLSVCRWLTSRGGPPVILLTAMAEDADRIVGLELGADDYVVKPFNPRELLARIRAVLRRAPPRPVAIDAGKRKFDRWIHDPTGKRVVGPDGEGTALTTAENRLLGIFLDHPHTVLSRDQLLDMTAGREAKAYDRAIDNQILRLRRKVEMDPKTPTLLMTEWGGGYRLAADVETIETAGQ